MDFLKAEIARKKREVESKSVLEPEKKYFKRGELAKKNAEEYLAKYGPRREEEAKATNKDLEAIKSEASKKGKIKDNFLILSFKIKSFRHLVGKQIWIRIFHSFGRTSPSASR